MRYFPLMAHNFDDLLGDVFNHAWAAPQDRPQKFVPQVDVEEAETHYLIKMDIPGVKKEDVKIEVMGDELILSGERKLDRDDKQANGKLRERQYGSFRRHFRFGDGVNFDKVEARYQDGVVEISLAKAEAQRPKEIKLI